MPSTVIASFSYAPASRELTITFQSARTYTYFNVPVSTARAFREAPSRGSFFNHYIRDRYDFRELPSQVA
jgi:hypothetical protein